MAVRWTLGILLFLTISASPRAAHAGGARACPLSIEWQAPSGCPSREDIQARVEQLVSVVPSGTLVAQVVVTDGHGSWRAEVRTQFGGVTGQRSLRASSCESLGSAVALVLALVVDPDHLEGATAPAPSIEASPIAPASPVPLADVPPRPARAAIGTHVTLGTSVVTDSGTLPSTTTGTAFSIDIERGVAALEGAGEAWSPRSSSSTFGGRGGRFTLWSGALRLCTRSRASWTFGACLGADVARVHGKSFGVNAPGAATRTWASPTGALELAWRPVPFLALALSIAVLVPLSRPTFALENVGPVYRPAPLVERAALGLRLDLF